MYDDIRKNMDDTGNPIPAITELLPAKHSLPAASHGATGLQSVRAEVQMSDHITPITDATFEEEVLKSDTPVLVDYWAEWCGPCKAISPVLEAVAPDYAGKVKIVKMNIDENPNTPPKYGIRSIPTLMLFKNGVVESTKIGGLNKAQLIEFLDKNA
jgi:thioredoxin 1